MERRKTKGSSIEEPMRVDENEKRQVGLKSSGKKKGETYKRTIGRPRGLD